MANQQISFIAVPGGFTSRDNSNHVLVSVFVSPRLQPDGTSLAGTDFVDWPARLLADGARFDVHFGDQVRTATMTSTPDGDYWNSLFDADTFVRPYTSDADSGLVGSYDAGRMHDLCKAAYQQTFDDSPLDPRAGALPGVLQDLRSLFVSDQASTGAAGSDAPARSAFGRAMFSSAAENRRARLNTLVDLAREDLANRRSAASATITGEIMPATGDPADELARFAVFHAQPSGSTRESVQPTADDTRLDFHQHITGFSEYPSVLRGLGLIIELEVDVADVPHTADGSHGVLRVVPHFPTPLITTTTITTPATAFLLNDNRFDSAPEPGSAHESVDNLLDLAQFDADGHPIFRIIQVDIDHAGFAAIDVLNHSADDENSTDGELSSLRSSGVSIARQGAGLRLMDTIAKGLQKFEAITTGQDLTLFADDLIRGYRIDVRDATSNSWRSLHRRIGTYHRLDRRDDSVVIDEGFVQPTLVQPSAATDGSTTHDPSAPNYVSESMFNWQGWSLAARRPGPVMPQSDSPNDGSRAPTDVSRLQVTFKAQPHTLPRLRFGEHYDFRVRLVNIVGDGPTLDGADEALAGIQAAGNTLPVLPNNGDEFRYQRFEAVPSPVVLPRIKPGPGASVQRIVVRSDKGTTPAEYAALHPDNQELVLSGERHILAPSTSQVLAEAAGLFDTAIGTGEDIARTHELLARAEISLGDNEIQPEASVSVPYLPDPLAVGAALRNLPGLSAGTLGGVVGDDLRLDEQLPDGPVGSPDSVITVGFGAQSAWPDTRGFRLRLDEGTGAPAWDAADRVLTVFLPKGETRTINLSADLPGASSLPLLGMWGWLAEWLGGRVERGEITEEQRSQRVDQLLRLAILGQLWMLTPAKELTLVHAVEQPVLAPAISSFNAIRFPGNTFAYIDAAVRVHGKSTGQLELFARWRERVDGPPEESIETTAPVLSTPFALPNVGETSPSHNPDFSLPVATYDSATDIVTFRAPDLPEIDAGVDRAANDVTAECAGLVRSAAALRPVNPPMRTLASDLQREVRKTIDLAGSFPIPQRWDRLSKAGSSIEGMASGLLAPDGEPGMPELPTPIESGLLSLAMNAGILSAAGTAAIAELDRFTARHQFGDTKYRSVTYRAVATSRFGDCFDDPAVDLTATGEDVTVDVLSTASPQPPGVSYVVPAFAWQRNNDPGRFESTRDGMLRIHLQKPWFSSGDGELLGVVVADNTEPDGSPSSLASLSQWGRDPLWTTADPGAFLTKWDFHNAVTIAEGVLLPDRDRRRVTVLGFEVQFEEGRCFADILMARESRSYYPFVRLAVVRLQPKSVPEAEISSVVLTNFAQLTPRRTVSVTRQASSVHHVIVGGLTHDSSTDPAGAGPAGTRVAVSVQERIPGTVDDVGWVTSTQAVITEEAGWDMFGPVLWGGTVEVPSAPPGTVRLLIEEFEDHPRPQQELGDPTSAERVVFAETVVF